jgi:hypothetical protein
MKPHAAALPIAVLALGCAAAAAAPGQGLEPVVRCEIPGDPDRRVFRLERPAPDPPRGWTLAYRDRQSGSGWIRLALPGARPKVEPRRVTLDYRSPNGGIIVALVATPESSTLDVYVSYELEVNVDVGLKPEIDHLNTNGVVRTLRCELGGAGGVPGPGSDRFEDPGFRVPVLRARPVAGSAQRTDGGEVEPLDLDDVGAAQGPADAPHARGFRRDRSAAELEIAFDLDAPSHQSADVRTLGRLGHDLVGDALRSHLPVGAPNLQIDPDVGQEEGPRLRSDLEAARGLDASRLGRSFELRRPRRA